MTVGVVLEFPSGTTAQYDEINRLMGHTQRGPGPAGMLFHWSSVVGSGLLITDVWQEKERFEEFARDKIGPYAQQVGMTDPPKITFYDVHNYMVGSETTAPSAPVAVIMDFAGDLTQYDEVIDLMGLAEDGKAPGGGLFHWVTAPTPGTVRVTDVWQDRQTFDKFAEDEIGPYTAKVGVPPPTSVTFHDVYNYYTAGA